MLLRLLDKRFPDKDDTDEQAETLRDIFALRAKEGETIRQWIASASGAEAEFLSRSSPEEGRLDHLDWRERSRFGLFYGDSDSAQCFPQQLH